MGWRTIKGLMRTYPYAANSNRLKELLQTVSKGGQQFPSPQNGNQLFFPCVLPFLWQIWLSAVCILQNFHEGMNVTPSETILLFFILAPF
jgi:hypothetical protein